MSKPILYYDDASPPVRSCLILIKMLKIEVEFRYVDLFKGEHLKAEFLQVNPAHTVPTLIHDDLVLTDSHVIMMHLCDTFAEDEHSLLYPLNYKDRMKVIDRLLFECSILFRRDSDVMSEIVRKGYENIDMAYHKRKLTDSYGAMEKFLIDKQFMAGAHLTIADISLVTTLSTVQLMFPVTNEEYPLLCAWFSRVREMLPFEINQKGLNKLRSTMEGLRNFEFPNRKVAMESVVALEK